ncbi:MaoC family dehydratase [Frigoribacterium sp. CG_9.8]|uniref:MaoC family dehydratase n=1 Tax=Frigoribacterium sp. CG_9.8 TaxID=2787733 RepID=UPI0018CAF0EE|nr:MaoC family dehydratase [Frigoribacterium sp. CG_9.8]MBG6106909.1 acyl dehydratase [Frigoribacterium sp. CG_9.8]
MTVREGWNGRFFEDFEVGDVYQHGLGRTITQADNIWFTLLTQNTARVHFDSNYAKQTEFGRPLVNSTFTLALVTGQSVNDVSYNVMANLSWNDVQLPNPLFEGDTVYSSSEVIAVRESRSRPNVGIVTVRSVGVNQSDVPVITFERTVMVYRRGFGPPSRPVASPPQ